MIDFKKQGKKNRKMGKAFELEVRRDLEKNGWLVSKWCNNVEFNSPTTVGSQGGDVQTTSGRAKRLTSSEKGTKLGKTNPAEDAQPENNCVPVPPNIQGKLIPAKSQYNPFRHCIVGEGSGFPDFIAFRKITCEDGRWTEIPIYQVIGIECKKGKYLDKEEKKKIKWYLENGIFHYITIAFKNKQGEIGYVRHQTNNN